MSCSCYKNTHFKSTRIGNSMLSVPIDPPFTRHRMDRCKVQLTTHLHETIGNVPVELRVNVCNGCGPLHGSIFYKAVFKPILGKGGTTTFESTRITRQEDFPNIKVIVHGTGVYTAFSAGKQLPPRHVNFKATFNNHVYYSIVLQFFDPSTGKLTDTLQFHKITTFKGCP